MADNLITLATLFLLGLAAHWLGIKTRMPRISLLVLIGIAIGPSGLNLFAEYREQWFPIVSDIALVMLGFVIGGSLTMKVFREHGRDIMVLSLGVAAGTFAAVFAGLMWLGAGLAVSLLMAAIATATDPAATAGVLMDAHRQSSNFGQTLLGIVAIDDAWGLLIFSLCLVIATGVGVANGQNHLVHGLWEIAGAIAIGVLIGLPMAFLTGRIRPGEPTLVEALGLVFLCGGLALKFQVSHLLAAIVMGATVANLARHHDRPFHAIEGIEWPFLVLFFILAGASLEMTALLTGGLLGLAYIALRAAGKVIGGYLSGPLCGLPQRQGALTGIAMLPQAGVAVAMALSASQAIPEHRDLLLTVTLGATVIFELIGPLLTRWALARASD